MKVSEVSKEEMKACADLINFLKVSDLHLRMNQAEVLFNAVSWLQSLAQQMILSNTDGVEKPMLSNVKIHKAKK